MFANILPVPRRILLLLTVPLWTVPLQAHDNYAAERNAVMLDRAQTKFMLSCGGCHGTLGESPPLSVPVLRGRAGYFLCTPQGREYVIRLPNVSRALMSDADLAAVMNFVTFKLGEHSVPGKAQPFTAAEVAEIRARPLNALPLNAFRRKVVKTLVSRCGAPADMLDYGKLH